MTVFLIVSRHNIIVTVHLAFGTKSAIFLCSSGQMNESLSVRVAQW